MPKDRNEEVYLETIALLVRVIVRQQGQLTKQDLNRAVRQILTALGDKVDPETLKSLTNELKDSASSLESAIAADKK